MASYARAEETARLPDTSDARSPVARLQRTNTYTRSTHATYRVHVSDGDSNPWATLIGRIVDRPGWSIARLARDSGVHRSTIFRWMNGDRRNLTLDSVRLVADAGGIDLMEALRAAAALVAPDQAGVERDEAEEMILGSEILSPRQKKMLLERYHRQVEAGKRQAQDDAREQIELLHDASG